jgi:hypothetical protein
MIEVDVLQGSPEWDNLRIGNPGASSFHRIITTEGKRSDQREKYLLELFDEIILSRKTKSFQSRRMKEGIEAEHKSRLHYEITHGVEIRQIGLCYKDEQKLYHCSPDGLIDPDGGFETKDALPHIQLERFKKGTLPTEHFTQCQGCLLVTGRSWWDFQSYCENMKPLTVRVYPDVDFLAKLEKELQAFCLALAVMVGNAKNL